MNNRTKQIWLPGLVTSGLTISLLAIFQHAGMRPIVLRIHAESHLVFYLPWLLTLPVLGFAGAYWSRRAGGGRRARIIAGTFPALNLLFELFMILPVALAQGFYVPTMAASGWAFLLNWGVLPAAALLIGALPVALGAREGSAESRSAA